jgi:hypothetical protein
MRVSSSDPFVLLKSTRHLAQTHLDRFRKWKCILTMDPGLCFCFRLIDAIFAAQLSVVIADEGS